MFKYYAPSAQPFVAPEFHGIPEDTREEPKGPDETVSERPELTLVRTLPASRPRLRNPDADEGDLLIPEILRKPTDAPLGRSAADDPDRQTEKRFELLPVAAASVAGLLLLLVGGVVIYLVLSASEKEVGVLPVKTISLNGQPQAGSERTTGADPAAHTQARGLDKSGFELRFNSAKAADNHSGTLKIKSQDRVAQIPLEKAGAANAAGAAKAPSRAAAGARFPVLGYASVPNPHEGWDEGQGAISAVAGKASSKGARFAGEASAGGAGAGVEISAAEPAATPASAEQARAAADSGPTTETSTVTADVNLRGAADKDAPVLAVVPNGSSVGVGACDRWWCAINFNGQTGYVGKKFVDGKG